MKSKQSWERNLKLLLGHSLSMGSVSIALAFYIIYWKDHGVAGLDASFLEGMFVIVLAIASVPFGIMADKFGRKPVLVAGTFLQFVGFALYQFNEGFWGFLLSEVLVGLGLAGNICTVQAMIVESVRLNGGAEDDELAATGQVRICNYFMFVIGGILGGVLASFDPKLPFQIAQVGPLSAFFLSLFLIETVNEESRRKSRAGFVKILELRHRLLARDDLSRMLVLSMVLAGFLSTGIVLFQPHFESIGHTTVTLGILAAATQVVLIAITYSLSQRKGAASCNRIQSLAFGGLGSGLILVSLVPIPIAAVFTWLIMVGRAYSETVLAVAISGAVKEEERGAILGFRMLLDGISRFVVLIVTGWAADSYGSTMVFLVVGMISLLIGVGLIYRRAPSREVLKG